MVCARERLCLCTSSLAPARGFPTPQPEPCPHRINSPPCAPLPPLPAAPLPCAPPALLGRGCCIARCRGNPSAAALAALATLALVARALVAVHVVGREHCREGGHAAEAAARSVVAVVGQPARPADRSSKGCEDQVDEQRTPQAGAEHEKYRAKRMRPLQAISQICVHYLSDL